jgi:hypothetical protein|tara:strand:+ start:327 stop:2672 length:2346 start_codon:yes stop_codon:yes gene_type:complete
MSVKEVLVFSLFLISIIFFSGLILAENHTTDVIDDDSDDELTCLPCGDSCAPYDFVTVASCLPPTNGEPICGIQNGECIVLGFEKENEEIYTGYEDAKIEQDAGTTPGSPFYFIDKFFDRFGDDLKVKEERIAEIKAMVEAGDIESAKEVLKDYMKLAEEIEHEIDPERREDAKRSSAAIRNAMKDIRNQLPPGEKGEFVSEIMNQEHKIATAAEIAGKIKELCTQLSELDPLEYSRMCKTDDNAPKWQKKLDKDLTKEQEKIAREFVGVMKDCFKTSGQDCRCEDIPFTDFSNACSEAAPLAVACDVDGNERACEKLDDLEMPELPDWLQDIWEELEEGMMESQYDMHMPKECVEAGATTPKECGRVMIETNAPEECRQPLLDSGCDSERDCRGICDKIMMEIHAPECAKAGITNPRECEKFMMPSECREEGLTPRECDRFMGSSRGPDRREDRPSQCNAGDWTNEECARWVVEELGMPRQCPGMSEEQCKNLLVRAWGGPGKYEFEDHDRSGPGPGFNINCQKIQNSMERLECFDKASSQTMSSHGGFDDKNYNGPCMTESDWKAKKQECRDLYGDSAGDEPIYGDSGDGYECTIDAKCIDFSQGKLDFEEIKQRERECVDLCNSQNKAWDFSYGECKCYGGDYPEPPKEGDYDEGVICDNCESQCDSIPGQRLHGTGCGPNGCECYYESDEPDYSEGEGDYDFDDRSGTSDGNFGGDGVSCDEGYESDGSGGCIPFGTGDYGFDDEPTQDDNSGSSEDTTTSTEETNSEESTTDSDIT